MPRESLHADVVDPVAPMGVGHAQYILVAVDELTRFSLFFLCGQTPKRRSC